MDLRIARVAVGFAGSFGRTPFTLLRLDGFTGMPRRADDHQIILGTVALLGVLLLVAARAPAVHHSLIGFPGWSSLMHGLVMPVQALRDPMVQANLCGDIPWLKRPQRDSGGSQALQRSPGECSTDLRTHRGGKRALAQTSAGGHPPWPEVRWLACTRSGKYHRR